MFVTFEGIDGSGKSTQARLLAEALAGRGLAVTLTRQPGGGELGARLRAILLDVKTTALSDRAELFLYLADRAQHVREVINPALARGEIVICDRFADSTVAYQGYGRGLDPGFLTHLNAFAVAGTMPGLTLLFDLPVETALARAKDRNAAKGAKDSEGRFEALDTAFHTRVRRGFLELARNEPGRFKVVDAGREPVAIAADVLALTLAHLGLARDA